MHEYHFLSPCQNTLINIGEVEAVLPGSSLAIVAKGNEAGPEDFWSPSLDIPDGQAFIEQYGSPTPIPSHDGTESFKWDNTLWGSADHFKYRWNMFKNIRNSIDQNEGGFVKFTEGYKYYGLNRGEHEGKKGLWYREWAPGAKVRPSCNALLTQLATDDSTVPNHPSGSLPRG